MPKNESHCFEKNKGSVIQCNLVLVIASTNLFSNNHKIIRVGFAFTLIMEVEEGNWSGGEFEWLFWRSKADSVCFHPGSSPSTDVIQGQKCLCCLIGLNSMALSENNGLTSFPVKEREDDFEIPYLSNKSTDDDSSVQKKNRWWQVNHILSHLNSASQLKACQ